jgi:hypothetical protein
MTRQLQTTCCALLRLYKLHYKRLSSAFRSTLFGETTSSYLLRSTLPNGTALLLDDRQSTALRSTLSSEKSARQLSIVPYFFW